MNFPVFPDGVADPSTVQIGADCFFVFATGDPDAKAADDRFSAFPHLAAPGRRRWFAPSIRPRRSAACPWLAYADRMREHGQAMILRAKAAFPMPKPMMQPPEVRQEIIDASEQLTTSGITPQEFPAGASKTPRRRIAPIRPTPIASTVGTPLAGALLLVGIGGLGAWLSARGCGPSRKPLSNRHGAAGGRILSRTPAGSGGAGIRRPGLFSFMRSWSWRRPWRRSPGPSRGGVERGRPPGLGRAFQLQMAPLRERCLLVRDPETQPFTS